MASVMKNLNDVAPLLLESLVVVVIFATNRSSCQLCRTGAPRFSPRTVCSDASAGPSGIDYQLVWSSLSDGPGFLGAPSNLTVNFITNSSAAVMLKSGVLPDATCVIDSSGLTPAQV